MKKNVVLTGMMGVGKSTIGRSLALKLSYDFVDIDKIIENNPDQVEALAEKPNLIGWFVGQTMKETQGKANPKTVNEILSKKLLNKG